MLAHSNDQSVGTITTAIAILWNRCVRTLSERLLVDFIEGEKDVSEFDAEWPELLQACYAKISDQMLNSVLGRMRERPLENVLQEGA